MLSSLASGSSQPRHLRLQAFRIISEALDAAVFVDTLERYIEIIKHAWAGQTQYVQTVTAVHDYINWVKPHVWETCKPTSIATHLLPRPSCDAPCALSGHKKDKTKSSVVMLTTARHFRMALRACDNAVCLWYKPDALHDFEYPTKKDDFGEPISALSADGSECYVTDP